MGTAGSAIQVESLTRRFGDLGNRFSAPYQWGTIGLFARQEPGKEKLESWKALFDPAKQPGPFLLLEDYRACIDVAVHWKGHTPNTVSTNEIREARDALLEVKKRARGFATSIAACNQLRRPVGATDGGVGPVVQGRTRIDILRLSRLARFELQAHLSVRQTSANCGIGLLYVFYS